MQVLEAVGWDLGTFLAEAAGPGLYAVDTSAPPPPQTRVDATGRTLNIMKEVIEGMRSAPPSKAELQRAKDSYSNRYVFRFTDADSVVGQLLDLEFYDRPRDLLETYIANINAVTTGDVHRVAKKFLHTDMSGTMARSW